MKTPRTPTHTVVRLHPDGKEERVAVRASGKSWIVGTTQYDKGTGTIRSPWHFQYARLLLNTLEPLPKATK
jgi:hypothetical protein